VIKTLRRHISTFKANTIKVNFSKTRLCFVMLAPRDVSEIPSIYVFSCLYSLRGNSVLKKISL
jgi:hypothetical protein